MLFTPCEICTKPVNETEAEQSLNFTEKVIGFGKVMCNNCRHSSDVLKHFCNKVLLKG